MAVVLLGGCQAIKQAKSKTVSALRVHMEADSNKQSDTQTITLLRDDPVSFTIEKEPILTEASLIESRVIETQGGFAIQVHFDESSGMVLEQYSAANPGKHFLIWGQWGERISDSRWLAAPLITRRIVSGVLSFTPDMSRTNADRLVLGLNNVSKNINKGQLK